MDFWQHGILKKEGLNSDKNKITGYDLELLVSMKPIELNQYMGAYMSEGNTNGSQSNFSLWDQAANFISTVYSTALDGICETAGKIVAAEFGAVVNMVEASYGYNQDGANGVLKALVSSAGTIIGGELGADLSWDFRTANNLRR